jgi:hypothetical protein
MALTWVSTWDFHNQLSIHFLGRSPTFWAKPTFQAKPFVAEFILSGGEGLLSMTYLGFGLMNQCEEVLLASALAVETARKLLDSVMR